MSKTKKPKVRVPTYNLNINQIEKLKQDATNAATREAFLMLLSLPLMVLRDKYGFGKKRLGDFEEWVLDLYDSVINKYVSLSDLIDVIYEETGIKVGEKRK